MRKVLPWLLLITLVAWLAYKLHTTPFDYKTFLQALRQANPLWLLLATAAIYSGNFIRALRWRIFLPPTNQTPWQKLIAPQFIGFAALALFGRLGELVRPILLARRTALSPESQFATLTVERICDLAAFATLFALDLLLSPRMRTLPYLHRAGITIAVLLLAIAAFVLTVRLAAAPLARLIPSLASHILSFHQGLLVLRSPADALRTAALSLTLWLTIAAAYFCTLHAFPPPVHALTLAPTIILMAFSIAGSALPIPGGSGAWAGNVFALTHLLAIPPEQAAAAGLTVYLITNLAIIPAGLLAARATNTSLTQPTSA